MSQLREKAGLLPLGKHKRRTIRGNLPTDAAREAFDINQHHVLLINRVNREHHVVKYPRTLEQVQKKSNADAAAAESRRHLARDPTALQTSDTSRARKDRTIDMIVGNVSEMCKPAAGFFLACLFVCSSHAMTLTIVFALPRFDWFSDCFFWRRNSQFKKRSPAGSIVEGSERQRHYRPRFTRAQHNPCVCLRV